MKLAFACTFTMVNLSSLDAQSRDLWIVEVYFVVHFSWFSNVVSVVFFSVFTTLLCALYRFGIAVWIKCELEGILHCLFTKVLNLALVTVLRGLGVYSIAKVISWCCDSHFYQVVLLNTPASDA